MALTELCNTITRSADTLVRETPTPTLSSYGLESLLS